MKSKSSWLVSGIVGGLVFAAAVSVYRGTPTRPGYTRPAKRLVRIAPAVALATVLELGDRTGAAHEAYHDAVAGLADLAVAALVRRLEREEVETLAGPFPGKVHEHVLAGAKRAEMAYFRTYVGADEAVASDDLPHLEAFEKVATLCAFRAKLYVDEGKVDQAKELAEALLVFGDHILSDRVRYAGLLAGITVQELGLMSLALVYQEREDNEALDRLQAYANALGTAADRLEAKAARTVLRLPMPTGDLLNIAQHDQGRAFRVEAILKLGYCRLTQYATRADRRIIAKLLPALAQDDDPFIQAAAKRAAAITALDVRQLS